MKKVILILLLVSVGQRALAQEEQKTPEQREKEFYEAIENQVNRLTEQLDLADWQVFYVDSILTHNMGALRDEMKALNAARVSSGEYHQMASDKWMEETYKAFRKVLNGQQWEKYLKSGAKKDKMARDRRAEKRK